MRGLYWTDERGGLVVDLPTAARVYRRTPDFTHETVPPALLGDHATKVDVWGRIVVSEGRLRYVVPSTGVVVELSPGNPGVVEPALPHRVETIGTVRFHVEFLREAPVSEAPVSEAPLSDAPEAVEPLNEEPADRQPAGERRGGRR